MIPDQIAATTNLMGATVEVVAPAIVCTETAYDWWKRSKRKRRYDSDAPVEVPTDPSSAARAFFRPTRTTTAGDQIGGTGIAFVDAALLQNRRNPFIGEAPFAVDNSSVYGANLGHSSIVLEIQGEHASGKTWTLISLAARFAVATRASRFQGTARSAHSKSTVSLAGNDSLDQSGDHRSGQKNDDTLEANASDDDDSDEDSAFHRENESSMQQPRVIIFDSDLGIDVVKLAVAVRSLLLRQKREPAVVMDHHSDQATDALSLDSNDAAMALQPEQVQLETSECLSRINIATSDDLPGWVPILETMRDHLTREQTCDPPLPTLLLWDGFLSEPLPSSRESDAVRREVVRQVEHILAECNVVLVTATTTTSGVGAATAQPLAPGRDAWDRLVTHHIHLNRAHEDDDAEASLTGDGEWAGVSVQYNEFIALVQGVQTYIPFSVSSAGILS